MRACFSTLATFMVEALRGRAAAGIGKGPVTLSDGAARELKGSPPPRAACLHGPQGQRTRLGSAIFRRYTKPVRITCDAKKSA
jgi:hypothetical protein